MWILIAIAGLVQAALIGLFVYNRARHLNDDQVASYEFLKEEVQQKRDLWAKVSASKSELADRQEFAAAAEKFFSARESLKVERGRVTITQAELEALEGRLRELEEISRELEASATETKEELKILQRKESELRSKNDGLRVQIADSV